MRRKILYFVKGTSPTTQEAAAATKLNAVIRSAAAYHEGDFVEACDAVAGCFPNAYSHFPKAEEAETTKAAPAKETTAKEATAKAPEAAKK